MVDSLLRRYATRRSIAAAPTILLWWGSYGFAGGPTLGDLNAVDNLSRALKEIGLEHTIVSHPELDLPGHQPIANIYAIEPVRQLVFVCGPLTAHRNLRDLMAIQHQARKLAVGVSVLANHASFASGFDHIVARDGAEPAFFDLAVDKVEPPRPPAEGIRIAGLCLRGRQREYGPDRLALNSRAADLFDDFIVEAGLRSHAIDTKLSADNRGADIVARFDACDIVLTTRMHGALLALARGKPVIAIDQIPGGAKVSEVVGRTGWPFVFEVQTVTAGEIGKAFDRLSSPEMPELVRQAQQRMLGLTQEAIVAACASITGQAE